MNTHAGKTSENKIQSAANSLPKLQRNSILTFQFSDNRPEAITQQKLQEVVNNSPRVKQLKSYQEMAANSPQVKQLMAYQVMSDNFTSQQDKRKESVQKKENNTGLPDSLKSGIENLSGFSMNDVKGHYNSNKPVQMQAHTYTQGTSIYLASGKEKYLPHEAWHVGQKKQERVKPAMQLKWKMNINDDYGLEKERDLMGSEASKNINQIQPKQLRTSQQMGGDVAQLVNIQVGFDATPTQSMFAGPADDLTTNGLGNCIAIVAYHTGAPSQGAVMRHYDTMNAFVGTVPDAIGGGNALTFNAAIIGAVAAATAAQLVLNVPAAAGNTGFAVALGGVWSNLDPNTTLWRSRFNLLNAIVAGVGVEPIIAAATVNFDVATSTLS